MFFLVLVGFVLSVQSRMGIDSFDLGSFAMRPLDTSAALETARVDFTTSTVLATVFVFGVAVLLLREIDRTTARLLAPLVLVTFSFLLATPTVFLPPLEEAELLLLSPPNRDRAYALTGIYWGVVYSALVCTPSAMSAFRNAIDRADTRELMRLQSTLRAVLTLLAGWMISDVAQVGCTHRLLLSLLEDEQKAQMYQLASSSVRYYGATDSTVMAALIVPLEMRLRNKIQNLAMQRDADNPNKWTSAQGLNQTNYDLLLKGAALLSPFISSLLQ